MATLSERRLEIKSYNNEVLKDVRAYFEKYPNLPDVPSNEEETQIEKDLREEMNYLRTVLNR